MSFLSLPFALFLGAAYIVFHLSPPQHRTLVLLGLSYAFYLSWIPVHALVLLGLTVVVYFSALALERRDERGKFILTTTMVALLLALLATLKWGGWLSTLVGSFWASGGSALAEVLFVPLGLSYFLFRMVGYLLDVYWEKIPVERSFSSLALYFSFFPQIVSGPIQRAGDFLGQLKSLENPAAAGITQGLRRILFGLVKKIVIADRFALLVAAVHDNPAHFSPLELLVGAYCFTLQLYLDFSGVTDIAIGIGQLFGIKGPENFNLPFWAPNIQEFWRRWHMSLTSWLSDYLFLPLRMALRQFGQLGLAAAIFINMLAVGIWHGPKWTYAVFGAINGLFLVVSALTLKPRNEYLKKNPALDRLHRFTGPLVTFHLMVFAMIFFRADSVHSALSYVRHLIPLGGSNGAALFRFNLSTPALSTSALPVLFLATAGVEAIHWANRQTAWCDRFLAAPRVFRWGLYYAGILIVVLSAERAQKFIYAQF